MPIGRMPKTVDVTKILEWSAPDRTDLNIGVSVADSTADLSLTDLSNDPLSGLSEYFDPDINPTDYGFGGNFDFLVEGEQRRDFFAADGVDVGKKPEVFAADDNGNTSLPTWGVDADFTDHTISIDPEVRARVVGQMGDGTPYDERLDPLMIVMSMLNDPVPSVRLAALRTLKSVVQKDRRLPQLEALFPDALGNGTPEDVITLGNLSRLDSDVLMQLDSMQKDNDPEVRKIASEVSDVVIAHMERTDLAIGNAERGADLDMSDAVFIARADTTDPANVSRLTSILLNKRRDRAVREAAASLLPQFERTDEIVLALLGAIDDPDPKIRRAAINTIDALLTINDDDGPLTEAVFNKLDDEDPWVRLAAAEASLMFYDEAELLEIIRELMSFPDPELKIKAMNLVVDMDAEKELGTGILELGLKDGNRDVVKTARRLLDVFDGMIKGEEIREIASDSVKARRKLLAAIKSTSPEVRAAAISTIRELKIKGDDFIEAIIQLLKDDDFSVRGTAASALGAIGINNDRIESALRERLSDPVAFVRTSAIGAIASLRAGNVATVLALKARLHEYIYLDPSEAEKLAVALVTLGIKDNEVLADLVCLSDNEDEQIRGAAHMALSVFGYFAGTSSPSEMD